MKETRYKNIKEEKDLHSIYIVLTYGVFSSKEISANAKLILGEIISLLKAERPFVFASNSHFAKLFGLNKATISYHINRLKKTDFIRTEIFKKGCKVLNCPIEDKENHRHIYPTTKLLTLLEGSNTLSSLTRYPYQVKPMQDNNNKEKNNIAIRKAKSFPRENYNLVLDAYQHYKGIKLSGPEFLSPQKAIKTMFEANRKSDEIIAFMKWTSENLNTVPWMRNWTLWTIQKKIAEFSAGKLKAPDWDDSTPL